MKKISLDFAAYIAEQKDLVEPAGFYSNRWYKVRSSKKKKKNKTWLQKATALAREALEIYFLVQNRNNPLALGLGVLSSAGALLSIFEIGQKTPYQYLETEGFAHQQDGYGQIADFYLTTLQRLGYEGVEVFADEDEGLSVNVYTLENDLQVAFVQEGREGSTGPYVRDRAAFQVAFKAKIRESFGRVISLTQEDADRERKVQLSVLERPQWEIYVNCNGADEDVLTAQIEKALSLGVGRSYIFLGDPGTGKTTLAFRLAERLGMSMLAFNHEILSSNGAWISLAVPLLESDIILFDDIDRVWDPGRLLFHLDTLNASKPRVLIGTINKLKRLPKALRRPGRFDCLVRFKRPDVEHRPAIMRAHASALNIEISEDLMAALAEQSEGLTGAYLREIVIRTQLVDDREALFAQIADMRVLSETDEADEATTLPRRRGRR